MFKCYALMYQDRNTVAKCVLNEFSIILNSDHQVKHDIYIYITNITSSTWFKDLSETLIKCTDHLRKDFVRHLPAENIIK